MPSAERYAREKARAEAAGTTPYRERVRSVRKRAPGVSVAVARGHAPERTESLSARRRRREVREAFKAGPTGWCVVCGSKVEPSRAKSYSDRACGAEQVRRFRAEGEAWASFRGLAKLAKDRAWVRTRRAQSRAAGVPVRRPAGVQLG